LEEDAAAAQVQYGQGLLSSFPLPPFPDYSIPPEILENVNPDLSDSEFIERDEGLDAPTPGFLGSDAGDAPTPGGELGEGDEEEEEEEEEEAEGDIDEELAAELDLALGDEEEEADDEEDDEEEDDSEEDDEEEDDETVQARKLLNEEIRDLEAAVSKKNNEIASSANPLIRVRELFNSETCITLIFFPTSPRSCRNDSKMH
jgi:transcription initiation factor TFIID subunit 7